MSQQSFVAAHVLVLFCLVKERVASEFHSQDPYAPYKHCSALQKGNHKGPFTNHGALYKASAET